VLELPVIWADQDAMGHVNNTVFLRWFESARIAYLERLDLLHDPDRSSIAPILASVTCDFRQQVRYPDTVLIGASVERIGNSSLTVRHRVTSRSTGQVVAEGQSVMVLFDYEAQRSVPISTKLRSAIGELGGA